MSAAEIPGWEHIYSGKVRDLYTDGDRLLLVASDRVSAYDWVLPTPIPDKGRILTAMSLWWFGQMADLVDNHVISTDVPEQVAGRALICERLQMMPVECVVRGYLSGSGWNDYRATGAVCGIGLAPGLQESQELPAPIFTPATKAAIGEHDENISFEQVVGLVGEPTAEQLRELSLAVYSRGHRIAAEAGIILADTKFEFGRRPDGTLVLADEILTPDSSRFWDAATWRVGSAPASYDKQFVRDWLRLESGWDHTGDQPPPPLPPGVVERTREKYVQAYETLTGEDFQ